MQSVLYVDSRMRSEGTDSSFTIELLESLHLIEHGVRVDKLRITNSFLTSDNGRHVYYKDGAGGVTSHALPEQAYTGPQLAAAMQTATSRTTTYDLNTNSITQAVITGQEWLSDAALKAYSSGFPAGASNTEPLSLGSVLGASTTVGSNHVWTFVKMSPYDYLFLRSRRLTVASSLDPGGRHDVIAQLPLTRGVGAVETASSPDGVYLKLPTDLVLRNIDFQLTDYNGKVVDLRGRACSFELCFD